ncbi:MAG: hypothetical protein N2484_03385 [Clostridia bacterium]|nr:hypothetical protein [Clostridia bacterium]
MKKLVLMLVSAVILTVFIAFNYLLWDRENKIKNFEYINDTKNSSIDALRREIDVAKEDSNQLKSKITELEELNKRSQSKISQQEKEISQIENDLNQRNDLVSRLLQQADVKPMEEVIRKWIEGIDKGQYEVAYELQYNHSSSVTPRPSFEDFSSSYKRSIKSLKFKSAKPYIEELPPDKKGRVVFKAVMDVKKVEPNVKSDFNEGTSEKFFILIFDKQKSEWVIADILASI